MPVTLQPATLKYKNSNNQYQSADCLKGDKGDPGSVGIIAPAYADLTFPVTQGQPCIHDGLYYIANTDIQSSEDWTAAHWTSLTVGEQLCQQMNAIQGAESDIDYTKKLALDLNYTKKQVGSLTAYKYINYEDGTVVSSGSSPYSVTDYIDVKNIYQIKYKQTCTTASSSYAGIAFYDENKQFVLGIAPLKNQQSAGYVYNIIPVPANAKYMRASVYTDTTTYGDFELYFIGELSNTVLSMLNFDSEYVGIDQLTVNRFIVYSSGAISSSSSYCCTDYIDVSKYEELEYKRTGTTAGSTDAGMAFYDSSKVYISGIQSRTSQAQSGYGQNLYRTKVPKNAKYARFTVHKDTATYGDFKLYGINPFISAVSYAVGKQWEGKTWYAYGTSITNISSEGKYPTYLAEMSGMILVNKGISGGGIGDLGAYSHGQVYSAICNITDGKLNADLITLETGANDCNADVPLGTIYDTGTSTLAGCLNDCIRYLQKYTDAQICIINSPATTTEPTATNKYYEWADMVRRICDINRVHFLNNNNNMGYAKLSDSTKGSKYVVDSIHQTKLGGYIMAENMWCQIKNIPCFRTSM